ncbi:MAG: pirin family protein [Leptospiraceae bacterium]|nr:pirin family protein [Leptospiraceae bacterium]
MSYTSILKRITGTFVQDGAGVNLSRIIGQPRLRNLDPFLLLDEFKSESSKDYIAGFPSHPHRGFETVTYMLHGAMRHRDNQNNEGHLRTGDIQWMTAGRGIVHEEMPEQDNGLLWGFQLWVNLPSAQKMCNPRYQDIASHFIQEINLTHGGIVRIIAGQYQDKQGVIKDVSVKPEYFDVRLTEKDIFEHTIEEGRTSFLYVYLGEIELFDSHEKWEKIHTNELAVLDPGKRLKLQGEKAGVLFLSAFPIREPIVQYGPFVMNNPQEIEQAINDYREGNF